MKSRIRLASIITTFGLLVASDAVAQAYPAAGGAVDGVYLFVSAQNLTPTFVTRQGRTGSCPESVSGPLTVTRGQVYYTTGTGRQIVGTINPQGQLQAQLTGPGEGRPLAVQVSGTVDAAGTARAQQRGNSCSYYITWQKQQIPQR
jgi:hypothetical protein